MSIVYTLFSNGLLLFYSESLLVQVLTSIFSKYCLFIIKRKVQENMFNRNLILRYITLIIEKKCFFIKKYMSKKCVVIKQHLIVDHVSEIKKIQIISLVYTLKNNGLRLFSPESVLVQILTQIFFIVHFILKRNYMKKMFISFL